jgi:hypothetical protein
MSGGGGFADLEISRMDRQRHNGGMSKHVTHKGNKEGAAAAAK